MFSKAFCCINKAYLQNIGSVKVSNLNKPDLYTMINSIKCIKSSLTISITGTKWPKLYLQVLIYMLLLCSSKIRDRYRLGTCRSSGCLGLDLSPLGPSDDEAV